VSETVGNPSRDQRLGTAPVAPKAWRVAVEAVGCGVGVGAIRFGALSFQRQPNAATFALVTAGTAVVLWPVVRWLWYRHQLRQRPGSAAQSAMVLGQICIAWTILLLFGPMVLEATAYAIGLGPTFLLVFALAVVLTVAALHSAGRRQEAAKQA
jgi:hypothetical protein